MENKGSQFVLSLAGGVLYLHCQKCGKSLASEKVPFPGKPEQQTIPRQRLNQVQRFHIQKCK